MSRTPDPVRWRDAPDPALPAELARALAHYPQRGPSAQQLAAMAARLESQLATNQSKSLVSAGRAWRGWLIGALVAGLGVGGWWASQRPDAPTAPQPVSAQQPEAQPESALTIEKEPAPVTAPPPAVAAAPKPSVVRAARPRPRTALPAPSEAAQASDPLAELRLLTPARQILAAQPARALALAREHAARFPLGTFAEERRVITIEALVRTGAGDLARQEANAFRRDYPKSTYLGRVEEAIPTPGK